MDSEAEVGTANLRERGGGSEEGGNAAEVCLFRSACSEEVEVAAVGGRIGIAEDGTWTYEGMVVIDDKYLEQSLDPECRNRSKMLPDELCLRCVSDLTCEPVSTTGHGASEISRAWEAWLCLENHNRRSPCFQMSGRNLMSGRQPQQIT